MMNILDCNQTLGTCCSEHSILPLTRIIVQTMEILQILIPIILLVMAMFQMSKMMMYPDDKKQVKSLYNKFIAATIVFVLPTILSVTLGILSENNTTFDMSACLKEAKENDSSLYGGSYKEKKSGTSQKLTKIVKSSREYELGKEKKKDETSEKSDIIEYAKQFLGGRYCKKGKDPHKCADCVGFVMYLLNKFNTDPKHHKVTPYMPMPSQPHPELYTPVSKNDIQAGDIVTYTHGKNSHHVAMFTGNGDEIIHAANERAGIILTKHYNRSGVEGIYRFKYLKK